MYDAILISTHYSYDSNGNAIPSLNWEDHEDLSTIIPLGIIHIAQYLHDCGFQVRVVHVPHEMEFLRRFGINQEQEEDCVEKILRKYPAHVCGIQAHWYLYCGGAVYISKLYKKIFPDSKVFLGGYMATACWKEFLNVSSDVDGVILGEGEKTFKEIVEKCQTSRFFDLNDVHGVAFRGDNNDLIYNPPQEGSVLKLGEIPIIY